MLLVAGGLGRTEEKRTAVYSASETQHNTCGEVTVVY